MSEHHCHSCGMNIETGILCNYCTDDKGELLPFEEQFERMVQWAQGQNPDLGREEAETQTRAYMKQRPAWADHPALND